MRQAVIAPEAPTPPPSPQSFGEQIGKAARDIAASALAEARAEIRSQLDEARAERTAIAEHLDRARSGPVRRDLQRELNATDLKIQKLEEALSKIESKLTTTDGPRNFATTAPPPSFPMRPMNNFDPTPVIATSLGILFVAFPLTLAIVRFIWKRSTNAPAPAMNVEQTRRFDRLEQSVDAIAIEVERISENQRYLTRLLADSKQSASVGSGAVNH